MNRKMSFHPTPSALTSIVVLIGMFATAHAPVHAGLISPEVGWQAELATLFHNVSGMVTIIDDDTVRVDDFIYDGGGPSVFRRAQSDQKY